MNKYLAFAKLGFRQARAEPGELLGRAFFFVLILGVFSAVWRAVAESGASTARQPAEMLWYLAVTEWVLMSAPLVQFEMEEDIRRGDVAYQIARPASWLGARLAHGLGALAVRAPVMLVVACAAAWSVAGPPKRPLGLGAAIAFGLVAAVVVTLFHVAIGVAAFWLGDVAPAYWIWQKLLFVLGGLLLPLQFYPALFVRVARLTPFPALLAGPASLATGAPLMRARVLAPTLALWALVGWVVARAAFSRAVRRLHVNGG
ncbi:MAG TPA: ABC-2 family transporter protein [Gemmatimonadaceae bacterium]|jgi:viologen exporter family transport system permease protein|nr:ABC-2 family transporter protein [Gemmatimonadaceae bacterium]